MTNMLTVHGSQEDEADHLHTSLGTVSKRNTHQLYGEVRRPLCNTLKEKCLEDRKTSFQSCTTVDLDFEVI